MEFLLRLLPMFTFLTLVLLVTTHAASPPELYWRSVLPSAEMPKAITDLLIPGICVSPRHMGGVSEHHVWGGVMEHHGKHAAMNLDDDSNPLAKNPNLLNYISYNPPAKHGAMNLDDDSNPLAKNPNLLNYISYTPPAKHGAMNLDDDSDPFAKNPNLLNYRYTPSAKHAAMNLDDESNPFAKNPNLFNYDYIPSAKHAAMNLDDDSNPLAKNPNFFRYIRYTSDRKSTAKSLYDNLRDSQGKATNLKYGNMLFLERNLHPGMKVELYFTKDPYPSILLPRQVANWLPFSSNKLQDLLNMFSIKPGSNEAHFIAESIFMCEQPGLSMENKHCPTSLEAMVDFSTSLFGENVHAISAEIEKPTNQLRNYTVLGMKRVDGGESPLSCHKMRYPYVVHYCHKIPKTKAYHVALEGADGTKAKGVALCHDETAEWNPANVAFQVLNIKPGTPLCHFNPMDTIIWLPKQDNHLTKFSN